MRLSVLVLLTFLVRVAAYAQPVRTGLRGTVKTKAGEALPYAPITINNSAPANRNTGTITNTEGRYEIALAPGRYDVVFQYLGYQTVRKSVEIGDGFATLDVVLEEQAYRLAEVQAKAGNEDPAYTIMRRAIAKSRFHQLQVQGFTARNYGKASFTVQKLPAVASLFKKQLAEAERDFNFKVGIPILYEAVSEITFRPPAQYQRRIIATRNSQVDQVVPFSFSLGSFYAPKIAGNVSPLSPAAFAYYKFEYEGTFSEQGVEVSKIRVIPRSWGEGVFRGVIFIIENTWALHSFQLEYRSSQGFTTNTRATLAPIKGVWLPVNMRFESNGSFFGVDFTAQGVISQTYNQLTVNPAFVDDVPVIDEKKEKPAATLSKGDIKSGSFADNVKKQKELTTKNFKQLVNEYEKQQFKERKRRGDDVQVVRNDSTVVDSLAGKRGTMFWDSLRSVPLTTAETISYSRYDSLRVVREVKAKADSLKGKKKDKVTPVGFVLGTANFKLTPRTNLVWISPLTNIEYNTVEGYTLRGGLRLNHRASRSDSLRAPLVFRDGPRSYVGAVGRYQFGRKQLVGYGEAGLRFRSGNVAGSAGRYFYQFNPENPISPALNTITTLLFKQNFIKLYDKQFARLTGDVQTLGDRLTLTGSVEYAKRSEVGNYREDLKPWINWKNRTYTPNQPVNAEVPTNFSTHNALTFDATARLNLGRIRYRIRNGARITLPNRDAPELLLNYRRGILSGVTGINKNANFSPFNYHFVQAYLSQSVETGIRSRLSYRVGAGTFIGSTNPYFIDFKHFAGNEFWFQQGDPVSTFRLLPYYQYSTGQRFAEGHLLGEFRKLLITQITVLRLLDLRENLFVHYLATPASQNYTEVGYGLNGLVPQVLPFFRLEVIGQFQNGTYQGLGYRVGTTLRFGR